MCVCMLSQKMPDLGLIVSQVVFLECTGNGAQGQTRAAYGQEIESVESARPPEQSL